MSEQPNRLTKVQLGILRGVLSSFADRIQIAGLFGSRATKKARPNSDVDLVLYGDIDAELVDRIWTLFNDSSLVLKVDVLGYDLISHMPLKAHVDQVMQPLFTQEELRPNEPLKQWSRGTQQNP